MNDDLPALGTYFELMTANGAARVFHAAVELGVLERLAGKPASAVEMAESCGYAERPMELLLKSLTAMNLVTETDGWYRPTNVLEMMGPKYRDLGNAYWDHLPEFLKSGQPVMEMDDPVANADIYREQVQSLAWMMLPSALAAVQAIPLDTGAEAVRILDVGCGAAVWSMAFATAHANVQVVANDWDPVLDVARQAAAARGLSERYEFVPGNYHEVNYEEGAFDLILLGNVTHLESVEDNVALFSKLKRSLSDGGRLVIFDVLPEEKGQLTAALYEMGLALRTRHGQVFSAEALSEMLQRAGLALSQSLTFPTPPFIMGMIEVRA